MKLMIDIVSGIVEIDEFPKNVYVEKDAKFMYKTLPTLTINEVLFCEVDEDEVEFINRVYGIHKIAK